MRYALYVAAGAVLVGGGYWLWKTGKVKLPTLAAVQKTAAPTAGPTFGRIARPAVDVVRFEGAARNALVRA